MTPSSMNGCGTSLAVGASCTYAVTFSPGRIDFGFGRLNIIDGWGKQDVVLEGNGTIVRIPVVEVAFGYQGIGVPKSKTFTVTNVSRRVTLHFTSPMTLSSTGAVNFSASGCTGTLAPNSSCTVTVTYTPVRGFSYAILAIHDNGGPSPQWVAVSGVGR